MCHNNAETLTHYVLRQKLPLREGAPILAKWAKVSVPIHFKVYVWDITNGEEFARGSPPVMQQRGPFTFLETREKEIQSFSNDTTTIFYNDIKKFYFEPDLSDGGLDDEVEVINVPLMVSMRVMFSPNLLKQVFRHDFNSRESFKNYMH